jgi:ornithine cyclodeaminase
MVQFMGTRHLAAMVESVGLDEITRRLVATLDADFRRWPVFDKQARVASHSGDGVIELMPTSDGAEYGFKYVNGHPKNPFKGLQTVTAFGVLADVATGYPVFVSEMTIATAIRTAATSVLAAQYLARKDAAVMALIGLGAQSEFQAQAFATVLGIRKLRIFDIDPLAVAKFLANMQGAGFDIHVASDTREAVAGADIITTVTADKRNATILTDDMVRAGVHINAVGGDCPGKTELEKALVGRCSIFVEYAPQTRIEGEIQQMAPDHPVTELWEVMRGGKPGRCSDADITLFDSVGFAIEDFSVLRLMRDMAGETGHFAYIDLIADPADPKNLFGEIASRKPDDVLVAFKAAV